VNIARSSTPTSTTAWTRVPAALALDAAAPAVERPLGEAAQVGAAAPVDVPAPVDAPVREGAPQQLGAAGQAGAVPLAQAAKTV
jgi:hypothetical protein